MFEHFGVFVIFHISLITKITLLCKNPVFKWPKYTALIIEMAYMIKMIGVFILKRQRLTREHVTDA